jgi:diguanylate cyclase (GGDEF)-like protein/PAS domain S-box-containing protein
MPNTPTDALSKARADQTTFAVALMEHMVVPTFVIGPNGRVVVWNKACEQLTGVTASSVIGRDDHWRAFYDTSRPCLSDLLVQGRIGEVPGLYKKYEDVSEGHGTRGGVHVENWCAMPELKVKRYLAVDAGPVFDDSGKLIAVIETLRDLTDHKQTQIELKRLASHDDLTKLANRRYFDETLALEWCRARRDQRALSVVMLDIDCFKLYNDHLGHQMGDVCLRAVAGALQSSFHRSSDFVARYGGEEFIVLLPDIAEKGAKAVADRMCAIVASLRISHPSSPVADHVTLSAGVASAIPDEASSPDTLIRLADIALYQAKAAGKNKAVIFRAC